MAAADYDLNVTGCDLHESEATARLRTLGVKVDVGHSPAHRQVLTAPGSSRLVCAAGPIPGLVTHHRKYAFFRCRHPGSVIDFNISLPLPMMGAVPVASAVAGSLLDQDFLG